jgi:hypothetical protein
VKHWREQNGETVSKKEDLMKGKFFLACLVVFILSMLGGMVIHGMILKPDYDQLKGLFRAEEDAQAHLPFIFLHHILFAAAFVWIYTRGIQARPWLGQGVRFGIAVALLYVVPMFLIYYAIQPMPGMLVFKQICLDTLLSVILGMAVAWFYRNEPAGA